MNIKFKKIDEGNYLVSVIMGPNVIEEVMSAERAGNIAKYLGAKLNDNQIVELTK